MADDMLVKRESAVRRKLEGTLQANSLSQLVKERQTEKETFLLLDYSSSMSELVSRFSLTKKIDALRKVARDLLDDVACPQVGFGGYSEIGGVRFLSNGHIPEPEGGTPMAEGIRFCKDQGAKRLVVVSDGRPNDPAKALYEAQSFGGPIDIFYIGPEGDEGAEFMQELARISKGRMQVTTLSDTKSLTSRIRGALTDGGK